MHRLLALQQMRHACWQLNPSGCMAHDLLTVLAVAGAVPGRQAQLMRGSNCLAHLTDAAGQLSTDEVHVVLGQAVKNHQIPRCLVVADHDVSRARQALCVLPTDINTQKELQNCNQKGDRLRQQNTALANCREGEACSRQQDTALVEAGRLRCVQHLKLLESGKSTAVMKHGR